MPNSITLTKNVTASDAQGSQSFIIGDVVLPTNRFYWHLLWGNYSTDTGVLSTPPFTLSIDPLDVERQRERQLNDRRSKLPLSTEASSVTRSTTADGTLTKTIQVDVTAQTNLTSLVLSQAQKNALPIDLGTPQFQKIVYKVSPAGYIWSGPSKDPDVIPGSPNQNPLTLSEYRFMTNAPKLGITLYRLLGAGQMGDSVFVNGQPCQVRPVAGSAAVDWTFITFPDSQVREVCIRTTAGLGPINIAPTYDIWKPNSRLGQSMYCIGDSFSAPTVFNDAGNAAAMQEEGLSSGLEDWLGIAENYIDAVGGTGWTIRTNGNQGPNNNYQDRWPQVLRANPDIMFVPNGAANDCYNSVAPATIAAAIATCFRQLRAQNAKTKFIWSDGFTPPFGAFATNGARYTALRNILIPMLQDVGVYYIDTVSTPWLYGTGYLTAKNASGNSDNYVGSDATHLSGLGYRYLKIRLAHKLRRILLDDGTLLNQVI